MGVLLAFLIITLLLFGAGFTLHILWWVAAIALAACSKAMSFIERRNRLRPGDERAPPDGAPDRLNVDSCRNACFHDCLFSGKGHIDRQTGLAEG